MKKYFLQQAVKAVLVDMTVESELPMDMNELDIASVFERAEESLKDDKMYIRAGKLDKLTDFVMYEDAKDLERILDFLEEQEDDSQITGWFEEFNMVQRYETSFTVKSLLEEISY